MQLLLLGVGHPGPLAFKLGLECDHHSLRIAASQWQQWEFLTSLSHGECLTVASFHLWISVHREVYTCVYGETVDVCINVSLEPWLLKASQNTLTFVLTVHVTF